MNNMMKNLLIWVVIGLVLMTVFNQFNSRQSAQAPMEYSQFIDEVKAGRIAKVTIEGRQLKATTNDGKRVTSYSPGDIWLVSDLLKYGVKIEAKPEEEPSLLMNIFVSWFPMLLLIGVWVFFMRQMQGGVVAARLVLVNRGRGCWMNPPTPSPLPMWLDAKKPKKKYPNWLIFYVTQPSFKSWVDGFHAAS